MGDDERLIFDKALRAAGSSLGVTLSDEHCAALWRHRALVIEANRRFNLTRITEPAEFAAKHHADSLSVVRWCGDAGVSVGCVLDVGTGAGVPAVPLAMVRPDWQVTAIDGTGKKARFVADVARRLSLANLAAVHARAETWAAPAAFDLVVFKAIGALARCLKVGRRHVARDGYLVIYKTAEVPADEVAAGQSAARRYGFDASDVFRYDLPVSDTVMSRVLWIFRQGGDQPSRRAGGFGRHGRSP
ncbi:MAG: 16S rRNA (guanine(527)-N(7))-methyltransferase RsmG [Phycisphaerae bacterium]